MKAVLGKSVTTGKGYVKEVYIGFVPRVNEKGSYR